MTARPARPAAPGLVVLALAIGLGCWAASKAPSAFTPLGGQPPAAAAASFAAALAVAAAGVLPAAAFDEVGDVSDLEAKLRARDAGIQRLESELKKPAMAQVELQKFEKAELKAAREAEEARLRKVAAEERAVKDRLTQQELQDKAAIEKEEAAAKAAAEKELAAAKAKIQAAEKAEVEAARQAERAEKKAAQDLEKRERAAAAGDDAKRVTAEEKAEASINAATEKAEAAIIAANQKSEEALEEALLKSEETRVKAVERAEGLTKVVAEKAERDRVEAIEKAELAGRVAVEEEEQIERKVVETVGEIEKEELLEENEALEKAKFIAGSVASTVAPIIIPGVLMAVYAVLASFVSPPPVPANGGEGEEVRRKMGRKARPTTSLPTIDPWDRDGNESAPKVVERVQVGSGVAAGVALAASLQHLSVGSPGFFLAPSAGRAATSRSPAVAASTPRTRSGAAPSNRSSATAAATVAAASACAAVAAAGLRAGRRASRRAAARGSRRGFGVAMQAKSMEVNDANPLHVVVAGGGVGGLMLGKALSKVPHVKVTLLEQTSQFARFGGPIQLASNALSVIRDIDEALFENLMHKFTFTGCRRNGLVDALRSEWYCAFDAMTGSADLFSLPYTGVVDRPDLQELLLKSLPEGVLTNSRKVAGYEVHEDSQGVRVRCEDGTEVEADVLIGADGIWSAVRAQMWNEARRGPESGCTYSGYIVFAGEAVYQPEDYFEVGYKVYMGPKRYFVTSDVGRGRIQWYAFVAVPEGVRIPSGAEEKKDYVRTAFAGWSQQIIDLLDATPAGLVEDRALYDRPPSVLRSWADGPVALMGDACHPMMPNLGQGGCQAMEDAYTICAKLKEVRRRDEVPGKLQEYYSSRIVRASVIQGLSRIASDLLLSTFTFPWKPSEGLSAPHGPGRGDVNYEAVLVNYLKYLLPSIFFAQFSYLYSFHPFKWTADEVKALVGKVMDRHKVDAVTAWEKRMKSVENGQAEAEDAQAGSEGSFFKLTTSQA